jgi:hypothetical protein
MLQGLPLALALGGVGAIVAFDLYIRAVCELERWRARRRIPDTAARRRN